MFYFHSVLVSSLFVCVSVLFVLSVCLCCFVLFCFVFLLYLVLFILFCFILVWFWFCFVLFCLFVSCLVGGWLFGWFV